MDQVLLVSFTNLIYFKYSCKNYGIPKSHMYKHLQLSKLKRLKCSTKAYPRRKIHIRSAVDEK